MRISMPIPICVSHSWEHAKVTRIYQAFESSVTKIMDFVCPKNALTKRRMFKFIPNFLINFLGYVQYQVTCHRYEILHSTESEPNQLVDDVNDVFNKLVTEVKKRCPSTKNMSWEVCVKKDASVNAFCLPGGKVAITTGFLTMAEGKAKNGITQKDFIAAALGHEIMHAVAQHHVERVQSSLFFGLIVTSVASYALSVLFGQPGSKESQKSVERFVRKSFVNLSKIVIFLLKNRYSKFQEFEADEFGIKISHAARYNIDASIALQQIFLDMKGDSEKEERSWYQKAKDALSSHPPSPERLQKNREIVAELKASI